MSTLNSKHNRVVWVDIPFEDRDRAATFYGAVLAVEIHCDEYEETKFAVIDFNEGNGGCLVPREEGASTAPGILVYMNVDGRIRDALKQVEAHGGQVVKPTHSIGPHGFRAIIIDSEGNQLALHSNTDA